MITQPQRTTVLTTSVLDGLGGGEGSRGGMDDKEEQKRLTLGGQEGWWVRRWGTLRRPWSEQVEVLGPLVWVLTKSYD